jgi:transposase InsO family protein
LGISVNDAASLRSKSPSKIHARSRACVGLVLLLHNAECLNETLFASLPHARAVLDAWRADYNGVRPHSSLANLTPEEFRARHIAVAASTGNGQNFNPGLYL